MLAILKAQYGGPEVLSLGEHPKPQPQKNQILIKVMANSANPADWHIMRGKPYFARLSFGLLKPKEPILGSDFAGIVEAVGSEVQSFKIGDRVFGENLGGAFAEYCLANENIIAKIPESQSFETMAALPIAGLTAYQGLLEHGNLKPGEKVLINGASGGVGHFAIQIAKHYGAQVSAICSSRNRDFVKSLGADEVVPYNEVDLSKYSKQHDLLLDCYGNLSHADFKRLSKRGVIIGFTTMGRMTELLLSNAFSKYSLKQFTAEARHSDLKALAELIDKGKIKAHIHQVYPYSKIPEAIAFIEEMHTPGKVVMRWEQ